MPRRFPVALLIALAASPSWAGDEVEALLKDIKTAKPGATSPLVRAAWDKLVARGPAVLPQILEAMDTPDTVVANWLRTAFDGIVEAETKNGGKKIDADALLAFVKDPKRHGRARRLALEVVEQLRPGTSDRLIPGWLEDPEFRYEAVAHAVNKAGAISSDAGASRAFRRAFDATRDVQQARMIATHLQNFGVKVSVADHFGFLRDWHVIGPFDAKGMKGFKTVYPPEQKVDLMAELQGKAGKIAWKRYQVPEPAPTAGGHAALVNLREPLGDADDAVAYAYTAITVPAAVEVEFRGAADDNFTVWVNGKKAFAFEEYRNGVRLDRHRFKVKLQAGVNTVLVKVCQAPPDPSNNEPNWEFFLRIADETGKGIAMKSALPKN